MSECKCDLRTKLVGDGCRYCNPQEYIDKLIESLEELIEALEEPRKPLTDEEIDALSREMVKGNKSVNWLCRAIEAAHNIKGEA